MSLCYQYLKSHNLQDIGKYTSIIYISILFTVNDFTEKQTFFFNPHTKKKTLYKKCIKVWIKFSWSSRFSHLKKYKQFYISQFLPFSVSFCLVFFQCRDFFSFLFFHFIFFLICFVFLLDVCHGYSTILKKNQKKNLKKKKMPKEEIV